MDVLQTVPTPDVQWSTFNVQVKAPLCHDSLSCWRLGLLDAPWSCHSPVTFYSGEYLDAPFASTLVRASVDCTLTLPLDLAAFYASGAPGCVLPAGERPLRIKDRGTRRHIGTNHCQQRTGGRAHCATTSVGSCLRRGVRATAARSAHRAGL